MKRESAIELRGLSFSYGEESILENLSVKIERGRFYSIIGPNGSGKTTIIKAISKLLDVKRDTVYIRESDICSLTSREISKSISTVPQNTNVDFDFTLEDIVLMGRAPYIGRFESESSEDIRRAREAMEMTNVYHLREKSINSVSGGERQRAIIARAITQDTDIILLDEPISHIDLRHQVEILDTISKLKSERGITVISILHDLNLASEYSDEILLVSEGKLVSSGSPLEVLSKENISSVYGVDVDIYENPRTKNPYLIPIYNQFI